MSANHISGTTHEKTYGPVKSYEEGLAAIPIQLSFAERWYSISY